MAKQVKNSPPEKRRNKFSSKFSIIFGVFILVFISVSLAKEIVRRYEVSKEIKELEQEIVTLESRNAELDELIAFFNTEEFLEKEARTRLNLQKPGEQVMIIPDVQMAEEQEEKASLELSLSNPAHWWNHFFAEQ